jgi:hypothetical protein
VSTIHLNSVEQHRAMWDAGFDIIMTYDLDNALEARTIVNTERGVERRARSKEGRLVTVKLLPADFDAHATAAVMAFWTSRTAPSNGSQGGTRDGVLGGKNMDAFVGLVRLVAVHCGLPASAVYTNKGNVILPGYFRATKNWDVLVIHRRRLIAVFEFKSQVGSF